MSKCPAGPCPRKTYCEIADKTLLEGLSTTNGLYESSIGGYLNKVASVPKAEVHLHMEGCFEAVTIAQWAKMEGVELPRPQEDLFKFAGLAESDHVLPKLFWAQTE